MTKMTISSAEYSRAKLQEEMGELSQVLGKLAAFPDGNHPDGGPGLFSRLHDELADVYAALRYFREQHGLDYIHEYGSATSLWERINTKLEKFRAFGEGK